MGCAFEDQQSTTLHTSGWILWCHGLGNALLEAQPASTLSMIFSWTQPTITNHNPPPAADMGKCRRRSSIRLLSVG